jgi:hypothetical protein
VLSFPLAELTKQQTSPEVAPMARKDKISIIRSEEFASVEDELAAAVDQLENANSRILALLESETAIMGESPAGNTPEEAVPDPVEQTA